MKKSFIFLITCFFIIKINAQQKELELVKNTISAMFLGMKNSDSVLVKSCFTDSAILQTISNKNNIVEIKNENISKFLQTISSLPKGFADERISFKNIKIDNDLASVWTHYQFFANGKFSHCGVNSFQLVRLKGLWKIQYIIDTRRKENCL